MNKQIQRALTFATEKHKGQFYGTKDFIYHPLQVYEIIKLIAPDDINLQAASLLHDILENTAISYDALEKEFGSDVAFLVNEVTKTSYNTFPSLLTQRGYQLKFADRLSNLSNMDGWSDRRKRKYMKKSRFWKSFTLNQDI